MVGNKPLGIILYNGDSLFDGERIVVIATGVFNKTENVKTGNMIQIWILRADIPPILAAKLGEDKSICGNCKHRFTRMNSCYVNLAHGPMNIYKAYHRNRYVPYTSDMIKYFVGKNVRIGSYGDPSAVPIKVWKDICSVAFNFTGYSHQWKTCDQELKKYCLASTDSKKEHFEALQLGWRSFRIRLQDSPVLENEFICPASKEGGEKTNCSTCGLCGGLSVKTSKNVTIIAHGVDFKVNNFRKGMKAIKNKKRYTLTEDQKLEKLRTSLV